jgi:hypothetical protein
VLPYFFPLQMNFEVVRSFRHTLLWLCDCFIVGKGSWEVNTSPDFQFRIKCKIYIYVALLLGAKILGTFPLVGVSRQYACYILPRRRTTWLAVKSFLSLSKAQLHLLFSYVRMPCLQFVKCFLDAASFYCVLFMTRKNSVYFCLAAEGTTRKTANKVIYLMLN